MDTPMACTVIPIRGAPRKPGNSVLHLMIALGAGRLQLPSGPLNSGSLARPYETDLGETQFARRRRSQCLDVAHGRLAKQAAVLAVELADAFVSNLKGCARRVQSADEHPLPG